MKICTFNVNSIKARKELVLDWLNHRQNDLDILCLQELKLLDEFFPHADFEKLGYTCQTFGQKAYNGVAICSQTPLSDIHKGFNHSQWDEHKRFISAQFQDIILINLYAPHGGERNTDKYAYKQEWYSHLISYLDKSFSPQAPLIILGDLNVAHTAKDVYSEAALRDTIGTMPEERGAFTRLLEWGLFDVYRHLRPQEQQFTWWGYMGGAIWKNEGMRIDYILCTQPLIDNFNEMEVDMWPRKRRQPTPSDHAPLIATIDLS